MLFLAIPTFFFLLGLKEGLQLTGVAMVNLREQPGLQVFVDYCF